MTQHLITMISVFFYNLSVAQISNKSDSLTDKRIISTTVNINKSNDFNLKQLILPTALTTIGIIGIESD